jgi:membrane protein DedA with SNARE-associated domain
LQKSASAGAGASALKKRKRPMEHLQSIIAEYGVYFVFLGTLLEGETVVIMAGFLSHQGMLDPLGVVGAAFLGSWINDQGLFYVGRYFSGSRFVQKQKELPVFAKALGLIERNSTQFILAFRFLYGLRTVSPLALGISSVPASRYLLLNTISAALWAPAITGIGYALGALLHGAVGRLPKIEHRIGAALGVAALSFIAVHLIARRVKRLP